MGVKTKIFGPKAWLFLEGIACFIDDYIQHEEDDKLVCEMRDMARELFFLFSFVLCCVFCRISYREFTYAIHPSNKGLDINRMVMQTDGVKKLVLSLIHI